jgi:hypothetical protein
VAGMRLRVVRDESMSVIACLQQLRHKMTK